MRFKRWVDTPARGWWSADLHVHRNTPDMPLCEANIPILALEGLKHMLLRTTTDAHVPQHNRHAAVSACD